MRSFGATCRSRFGDSACETAQDPNYTIMSYSLAILRGLAVETEAQELFPSMGALESNSILTTAARIGALAHRHLSQMLASITRLLTKSEAKRRI